MYHFRWKVIAPSKGQKTRTAANTAADLSYQGKMRTRVPATQQQRSPRALKKHQFGQMKSVKSVITPLFEWSASQSKYLCQAHRKNQQRSPIQI